MNEALARILARACAIGMLYLLALSVAAVCAALALSAVRVCA